MKSLSISMSALMGMIAPPAVLNNLQGGSKSTTRGFNRLSQAAKRKRQRQYQSQSFKQGKC